MSEPSKVKFTRDTTKNELDITELREHGVALHEAICNAVKDTQGLILAPLPDVLVMTARQYEELDPLGGMASAYQSKDRIYMTPMNAMDVVVKDPQNFRSNEDVG
jgi:hypothetical protein